MKKPIRKNKYIRRLKMLGVYELWLWNLRNENKFRLGLSNNSIVVSENIKIAKRRGFNFHRFIGSSFIFYHAKEGAIFWYAVQDAWGRGKKISKAQKQIVTAWEKEAKRNNRVRTAKRKK